MLSLKFLKGKYNPNSESNQQKARYTGVHANNEKEPELSPSPDSNNSNMAIDRAPIYYLVKFLQHLDVDTHHRRVMIRKA